MPLCEIKLGIQLKVASGMCWHWRSQMNEKWTPLMVSLNESDADVVEPNCCLVAGEELGGRWGPSLICRKTVKLMERSRRTSSPLSADKKRKWSNALMNSNRYGASNWWNESWRKSAAIFHFHLTSEHIVCFLSAIKFHSSANDALVVLRSEF